MDKTLSGTSPSRVDNCQSYVEVTMLSHPKKKSLRIPFVGQGSLSRKQKDELFVQLLRVPRVFQEAITRLDGETHFRDTTALEHKVIFGACREVYEKWGVSPGEESFRSRVTTRVKDILTGMGEEVQPDEIKVIQGKKGILARAFADDTVPMSEQYGLDLLKRFLLEREVFNPLADAFSQCKEQRQKPENLEEMLSEAARRLTAINGLDIPEIKSVGEDWKEHQERLKFYRDREIVGLRTGLTELDRRTGGLQGLMICGAKPGAGKTGFSGVEIPLRICRHHPENDAVTIVVSLDMERFDLYRRIDANLSDLDWKVVVFGSAKEDREPGSPFSEADMQRVKAGQKRLKKEQVDRRMVILDREVLGDNITAQRLKAIVETCKAKCKAKLALLVIDYLQLLPVPDDVANRSDLSADKFRVRMLQEVIEGSKNTANPLGDVIVAISEARKPSTSKDPWGQSLSELMGTARVGYAATAVLLYRPMSMKELNTYYDLPLTTPEQAEQHRQKLIDAGIAPLMLILEKGRDGMIRGEWGAEFHFRKTQFRELQPGGGTKLSKYGNELPPYVQDLAVESHQVTQESGEVPALPPPSFGASKTTKKQSKAKATQFAPDANGNPTTSKK